MKKDKKKIYHYAPISPAFIECGLKECNYYYSNSIDEVNCKDCLKIVKKRVSK